MSFDSTRQPAETGFSYPENDAAQAPEGTQAGTTHTNYTIPPTEPLDFAAVAAACLARAETLLSAWLPSGKREGAEYVSLNPTRPDNNPGSFKVNLLTGQWADFATGDKGGDLVSLYAYLNHLSQGEAARALAEITGATQATPPKPKPRKAQAWHPITPIPNTAPPPPVSHPKLGKPATSWTYCNTTGQAVCHVYRFDISPEEKEFRPLTFCCNEVGVTAWQWQALPEPRPLYNLNKLASRPSDAVVIAEGEKSSDAAEILLPGMVGTTSLQGGKSPATADWTPLAGRDCIIWMDNDDAGLGYAETVTQMLRKIGAARVRWVSLAAFGSDLPEKWDAADAVKEGWTRRAGCHITASR